MSFAIIQKERFEELQRLVQMMIIDADEILSVSQVAEMIDYTPQGVRDLVKSGELIGIPDDISPIRSKLYIRLSSVDAFIRRVESGKKKKTGRPKRVINQETQH